MSCINVLVGFGLRQAIGIAAGEERSGQVVQFVEERFNEPSRKLPSALAKASDRAWQTVSIAVAGDDIFDPLKVLLPSGEEKGISEQVRAFLQDKRIGFEGTGSDSRKKALAELTQARQTGLLAAHPLIATELAHQTASFQRHTETASLEEGAAKAVAQIAEGLGVNFPNLGKHLQQRSAGVPLLVSAFAYFFRREVEADDELADGLLFDGLRQLSASHTKALSEVGKALATLGEQFDRVFEQFAYIEPVVPETVPVAGPTDSTLLDLHAELSRSATLPDEVRRLVQEVWNKVGQAGMHGDLKQQHSCCIRSATERDAVKQLLARFHQLPASQQQLIPASSNGLGKLQFAIGDSDGARRTFDTVSTSLTAATAQAEVHFNAFLAAREHKRWDEALASIQKAATLHGARFSPFPVKRYSPIRILGADGFGTAFLCHDRNFKSEVVVKALHAETLGRSLTDVFREVEALRQLHHPAIIGVRDCDYADRDHELRPYIVMDHFAGGSLEQYLQEHGPISPLDLVNVARQIAQGMQIAHERGILHRGLTPENVLVRKEGDSWKVKVIDFGLALGRQLIDPSLVATSGDQSTLDKSWAETIKYAPPEQIGTLRGLEQGTYSDVFSFGKLCCQSLFKTTHPKERHWKTIPESFRTILKEILEHCQEEELEHRWQRFESVLAALEQLDPGTPQRKPDQETLPREDAQQFRQEQEEANRLAQQQKRREEQEAEQLRHEQAQLQREGETRLVEFLRDALDRTGGKPTRDVRDAANQLCRQHRVPTVRAKQIVREVLGRWHEAHPPQPERQPRDTQRNGVAKAHNVIPAKVLPKMFLLMSPYLHGTKFARITPGTFRMGSPTTEEGRSEDETQHEVIITKGFLLGATSVTRSQFKRFVHATNYQTEGEKNGSYDGTGQEWKLDRNLTWRTPGFEQTDDHPVVCVNWNDAVAFCEWLSTAENEVYRLPTEAEWEYACRAGTMTPYHTGTEISTTQANFNMEPGKTTPVGTYSANAWGLFDMHGNVWDWCADWYQPYAEGGEVDPVGPTTGDSRVLRGGSFDSRAPFVRSAHRNELGPMDRVNLIGFRLARTLK